MTTSTCLVLYAACSADESTTASPTITAPAPLEPATGAAITTETPTLRVANATGAEGLTYRFEVATDQSFGSTVASASGVAEGSGTTSWMVTPPLAANDTYFWRARASADETDGPFSPAASFNLASGFLTANPLDNVLVFDPLTNGTSVGEVGGGEFRPNGWMITDALSYIRYPIPPTPNGYVEFDVTNLRNPNPHSDKRNLMIMWDPTRGEYTTNPFRVHIAKLDTNTVTRWHMRLRFISNGQETNTGIDFFDWDPSRVYNFRLEWGGFPGLVGSQRARVLMDGREIMVRNYDPLYLPTMHWVELGMAPRAESLELATYSNVTIGVRQP